MTIEEDFDNFMKQLGESISEEELKALTAACQDVIPNEARENIKKQKDLFSYLQKINQLSQDNLYYLEHALEKICRPDLVTMVMDFRDSAPSSQDLSNVISGPARKYKEMNKDTGEIPEEVLTGLAKIELAPPPLNADRRKGRDTR
ncbi:astrocytic phosphoprotein PEA-15-like [Lytechinus pictus]|uniref:astrocytic phosphoprotein PEA-15-like n=1 Tax=Lytechinus pictus TaxID=7653 RepID=UPI00240E640E|nr:astrocytic phosphoprotein PEA-15-like [Lytechinus pictus]